MDYLPRYIRLLASISMGGVSSRPGAVLEVGESVDVTQAIRYLRTGAAEPASEARYTGDVPDDAWDPEPTPTRNRPADVRKGHAPEARARPERWPAETSERTRKPAPATTGKRTRRRKKKVTDHDDSG